MTAVPRRTQSRADRRTKDQGPPEGKERRDAEVPPVEIEISNTPEGIIVVLTNPLVVSNCFAVRDQLAKICRNFTTPQVTVDVSGIAYADTAGLGMLVEMRGYWQRERKELILRNPQPRVYRTLQMLHMDESLIIERS
jgi:anti-anti-sigma factor